MGSLNGSIGGEEMRIYPFLSSALGAATFLLLASCGGGGGIEPVAGNEEPVAGNEPAAGIDPIAAQRLIGGTPPTETGRAQAARGSNILSRSDSYFLTKWVFVSEDGSDFDTYRPNCSGISCTFGFEWTDNNDELRNYETLSEFESISGTTILSRAGLTVSYLNDPQDGFESLWSRMHHSSFGTRREGWIGREAAVENRFSYAFGDLSASSRPSTSGRYTGLMTGIHQRNGDLLLGDAELVLTIDGSSSSLDARFRNISNLTKNRAHTTRTALFPRINLCCDGEFSSYGSSDNYIDGGFYGNEHAEAAGVFEQSGMLGAFGALRE